MFFLDPDDPVRRNLEQLSPLTAQIAEKCFTTFFVKKFIITSDWLIVDRLNGDFPHNICLGCGSGRFQALSVMGITDEIVMELINSTDASDILDAFGEILNIYLAMLMDMKQFVDSFGILTQSIAQYSCDVNFYPKAWGCNGTLMTPERKHIYLGFAIKST